MESEPLTFDQPLHAQPLATRLRPHTLKDFVGQAHLVGPGKPLSLAIEHGQIFSMIFWGPPGVGKTTLARMFAQETHREFVELSAVSAGKADVREIVDRAAAPQQALSQHSANAAPVLFLDEIHRFNKAQQDFLLPYVEQGSLILIGATTENPSFEVIPALLSRSRVFVLDPLTPTDLQKIAANACKELSSASGHALKLKPADEKWVIQYANGDARKLLTLLENTATLYGKVNKESLLSALQSNQLRYDQNGEEHYNTISAFIKSMRASNVDAALYYLARMVAAGEDPLFIARRIVVFASEDVAAPTALVVANAVFQACQSIGYPECQENLAAGVVYLAQAPKDRRAYDAYMAALADVKAMGNLEIPLNLRNAPTKLMKNLGYGKGYDMYPKEGVPLLPAELASKKYFRAKK